MSYILLIFLIYSTVAAEDDSLSFLSDKAEVRLAASRQLQEIIENRKSEAFRILAVNPPATQSMNANSPLLIAIQALGQLRDVEDVHILLKHVASISWPEGSFSEVRCDYNGIHPAVKAIASMGPSVVPRCLDYLESYEGPSLGCVLIAISGASGSKTAAKKALQDRLSFTSSKTGQKNLKLAILDFDQIVDKEYATTALVPIRVKPSWEEK